MRRNKSSLSALLALVLLALPLKVGANTHVNQNPADHVTLVGVFDPANDIFEFKRVYPDGTSEPYQKFVVPEGKWLIITDIIWDNVHPELYGSSDLVLLLHGAPPEHFAVSMSINSKAPGRDGPSQNMTTGVVVKGGGWLTAWGWSQVGGSIFLYGYLSGNQP